MTPFTLTPDQLNAWYCSFDGAQENLALNVCCRTDPLSPCTLQGQQEHVKNHFNYDVEYKETSKGKNRGRCWLSVALNCIRIPFIKKMNLDDFEFSQAHLYYWYKIEICNYFLNNIIITFDRGEDLDSRLMMFLLRNSAGNGGQWDMVVNIITKYGIMPRKCFVESYNFEKSRRFNVILKSKLREYARDLRVLRGTGAGDASIREAIESMMSQIYKMIGICLGIPPLTFTWEYQDRKKQHKVVGPITPYNFYCEFVRPVYNVEDKISLVTDPRPNRAYNRAYTIDCLDNVVGGRRSIIYNNQPAEVLLNAVTASLKRLEPVWFGCETHSIFGTKRVLDDYRKYDMKLVFGTNTKNDMSKSDRLLYKDSLVTHAMLITAVLTDANNKPVQFRIHNSLSDERHNIVTAEWFKEHAFMVVVDKSVLEEKVLSVFNMTPTVVPPWDVMGRLYKEESPEYEDAC